MAAVLGPGAPRIELGSWSALAPWASPLRFEVFVAEQRVPPELEIDRHDPLSLHAVAFDRGDRAIGTGRLLPDGQIGRMAVVAAARGGGVGSALLKALMAAAAGRGHGEVLLNAQVAAIAFYRRHGFVEEGELFDDAGIAHRRMRCRLGARPAG